MPGRATASASGEELVKAVVAQAMSLGLEVRREYQVGRRIWGAVRRIDVVLTHPQTRKALGIECKYQGVPGSAEEKIPSTVQDIGAWPIPGIVVFSGLGFSDNMRSFLIASGKAVELEDLRPWLCLFFGVLDPVEPLDPTVA
jgi:hypothetical protein